MNMKRALVAIVTAASLAVTGCATTGSSGPRTVQQKIAACVGMMLLGAALGTLAGGDDRRNAAVGAGIGAGACAVWLAFENQRDRERIAQMQMAAASTGQEQTQTWIGEDGRQRRVSVGASTQTEMLVPSNGTQELRICRQLNTSASVAGATDTMSEMTCRGPDGNWVSTPEATLIGKA